MGGEGTVLDTIVRMARPDARADASSALAQLLGVDVVLFFIHDVEVGRVLPAPGFPQTLPGGPGWRELLARCTAGAGVHEGQVAYPTRDALCHAVAISDEVVFVALGGSPSPGLVDEVRCVVPLLAAMLRAERAQLLAAAEQKVAREAAREAGSLATALDRARNELQQSLVVTGRLNRELEDAHRRKDEFLAMLAHELRNPLSPMVTALHLLQLRDEVRTTAQNELDLLSRQLAHLTRLVDDLLDVSRITRGRIELRREPVALGDVIARAIESTRPTLDARRHDLSVVMPDAAIVVDADAVRLVQVFGNLLNNAAKYTDPGGHIRLEIALEDDVVVTRVIDDGVGLSPQMLPRVFDLFVQAERSLDRAQGGLGIGLRLVQALVELHGGYVAAHSDGVGTGSRFEVHLPVLENGRVVPAPTQRRTPVLAGRDLRVLVVDDNRDAASSLAELITAMGFAADVVYDGLVALQVAADSRPDLVLLDIGLPTLDGYEVARRLRRLSKDCCLVALTGYGSEADREAAKNAGFNAYVVKPIDVDRLTELLHLAASCEADVGPCGE